MSNILAIDSSTEACSVALLFNGNVTSDFLISQRDHTKQILPMIDALLKQSDCRLNQMDAIAFSQGPGSFTGVRIGIGVAQGLALGIDRPMIPVSTLETLAQGAYRISGAKKVIPAIDARMAEVYLGAYEYIEDGVWQKLINECVVKPDAVKNKLSLVNVQDAYYAGTGWQTYPNLIDGINNSHHLLSEAQDMLIIASKSFVNGNIVSVENAEATYLRNEVTWKKLPGRD